MKPVRSAQRYGTTWSGETGAGAIGIRGDDFVSVVEKDLLASYTEAITKEAPRTAIDGSVGRDLADGEIVQRDRLKHAVRIQMCQFRVAGRILPDIEPASESNLLVELLIERSVAARHGAELRLPDQPIAEIRLQAEAVGAEEARER